MTRSRLLAVLIAAFILPALVHAASPKILRLYEGPALPRERVVTLLYPTDIAMRLDVDGKTAGGSCFMNCMFRRPVQILPGKHRFFSGNMHMTPFKKEHVSDAVPPDAADLKVLSTSLLDMSLEFDFEATLEAGKTYAIALGYADPSDRNKKMRVWWREMPDVPIE
jgi:hypothetical protein